MRSSWDVVSDSDSMFVLLACGSESGSQVIERMQPQPFSPKRWGQMVEELLAVGLLHYVGAVAYPSEFGAVVLKIAMSIERADGSFVTRA